uniref:Uncharacterized protein n=1 Tax=Anolis carolinensis TaxID=28377 RepID=A0A803SM49_ANOCA
AVFYPKMPEPDLTYNCGDHILSFSSFQFVLKNYGENPENYNEELKKLEQLRQVRAFPVPHGDGT